MPKYQWSMTLRWGNDGRRDLKAEAVSLEHLMTHTPFNGRCPSCLRAKMLRKPARRIEHDPAVAPKKVGDLVNADHIIAHSDEDRRARCADSR